LSSARGGDRSKPPHGLFDHNRNGLADLDAVISASGRSDFQMLHVLVVSVDAGVEQRHHLPSAPGRQARIGMRNSSTAQISGRRESSAGVHLRTHARVLDALPGHDFQSLDLRDGVLAPVRLKVPHHNVAALPLELVGLFQHPVGLPDARGVSEEDLRLPLGLDGFTHGD
jgi:hypothetical protein